MPSVDNASISSFAFMLPISAAKAAPVLPARTMAAIRAPISRVIATPIRSATHISPPNRLRTIDPE